MKSIKNVFVKVIMPLVLVALAIMSVYTIIGAVEYYKADKVTAQIEGDTWKRYSTHRQHNYDTLYLYHYDISYVVAGEKYWGEYDIGDETLQKGDSVDIRVKINEENEVEMLDDDVLFLPVLPIIAFAWLAFTYLIIVTDGWRKWKSRV